jgi:penicillin-binding protein 2
MRAQGAVVALSLIMGLLGITFFRVQVLGSATYMLTAEENRLRRLPIPAPRGIMYDRNGLIIADNVPGYTVTMIYERKDSARATLERLRPFLGLDDRKMAQLNGNIDKYPGQPLIVDLDADFHSVSMLEERRSQFPNVFIDMRPKRRYAGPSVAHMVGYISEITQEQLDDSVFANRGYEQGTFIGANGLERQYELLMQGEAGVRYVEVDAAGRVVGNFGGNMVRQGPAGEDVHLNIDLELQQFIDKIFPKTRTGAVIALDPADGGVLALYSWPTYDPNAFVGGIDAAYWSQLQSDPLKPLYDRTVQGTFVPASTFKLVTAAIALERGVIPGNMRMPASCSGGIAIAGVYQECWKPGGHGSLDLPGAIMNSCNVYFYQLGMKIGLDRFLEGGNALGLGQPCGIDLPQEMAGIFPESRDFWVRRFGYAPREGETTSLAIGQGAITMTPLKMAQFYLALARDGSAPAPSIFQGRTDEPEGWKLDLSEEHIELLRDGMRLVTSPGGTAGMSRLEHWDLIGKTGSGENPLSRQGLAETHAWFAGMAGPWGQDPEIVLVALIEYGGGGSAVAAPVVAKAADFYLRKKYGMPIDSVQTLREHLLIPGHSLAWSAEDPAAKRARLSPQGRQPNDSTPPPPR